MRPVRLHAGAGDLTRRILRRIAREAAASADRAERAGSAELRIDTGGRTEAEAADLVVGRLRWPGPPG